MWLVYNAARQPNKNPVRFGLINSYPYDKNFSILAPSIDLWGKLMTHKNANFEQTSTVFTFLFVLLQFFPFTYIQNFATFTLE